MAEIAVSCRCSCCHKFRGAHIFHQTPMKMKGQRRLRHRQKLHKQDLWAYNRCMCVCVEMDKELPGNAAMPNWPKYCQCYGIWKTLLQWLFRAKVGQEREEISSSTNKKATTNDQEVKPNYVIVFRRGSVGVYRKSKGVEESKLGSKKFKPFTFLRRKDVATACFYSTLQLKRPSSINRRQARQHWIQSMKIMKKEDIARGLGISSTKADSAIVGNKVLPVTDSTLSTSTSINAQCGTSEKKETLKGERTKTLSRMKELLRWAAASKSDKGGKYFPRKVMQFQNRATLKAVPYDDQLRNDSPKISFRWDLESCSTTSSAYTALSTASSLKNDQIVSLPSLNSTKFQHLDDLEPKKGNWITSNSEFVVLEL